MARKARVEFEGAVYHVVDRGDRRKAIFGDDADRKRGWCGGRERVGSRISLSVWAVDGLLRRLRFTLTYK